MSTHGHTVGGRSPTYNTWLRMRDRCHLPSHHNFVDYGGRGIQVCDRWRNSFANFLEDMGERPDNKTLDRIDVNANYGPDNCRWATAKQQRRNQRRFIQKRTAA